MFSPAMAVALDQKYIVVKDDKFPSLHHRWVKNIGFVTYTAPPLDTGDHAELEEWAERLMFIEEDLHQLLQMDHDKFWCQVVFDEELQKLLDSYLRYAPRNYDVVFNFPDRIKAQHDQVHRLVFMTYLRMSTHKESKENFISSSVFGEILYENYLLDMAKLLDLCVLYGKDNAALLAKMVENVFSQQPAYEEDMRSTMPTILQVLENIMTKCGLDPVSHNSPVKLQSLKQHRSPLMTMSIAQFQDVLYYLCDTTHTLAAFLDIYPKASVVFAECNFQYRIASCYEHLVPKFHEAFAERDWSEVTVLPLLRQKLREAQLCMLRAYRQITNFLYLQPLLDDSNSDGATQYSEQYLSAVSGILSERRFLAHHETLYPLSDDVEMMLQAGVNIDDTRLRFLRDAVDDAYGMYGKCKKSPPSMQSSSVVTETNNGIPEETGDGMNQYAAENIVGEAPPALASTGEEGATARTVTGVELDSLVTSVKDLLPDLGEGFIELCLEEYNYSVENVINAVLEGKLPPGLDAIDRNIPREERPPPLPEQESMKSMLAHRHNIYDNDEFDVLSGAQVDMARVIQGKKSDGTHSMKSVLEDKSSIHALKPLYDRYGHEDRSSMYEPVDDDEGMFENAYDDEYDDTYDVNTVGADDADSADELTQRRPFTTPRILGGGERKEVTYEEEDYQEEVNEEERKRRSYQNFIEDPAVVREREAQRRATFAANRGGRGGRRGGRGQSHAQDQAPKTYDVQGTGQKGQGQSTEVNRNRQYKDKHKAQKANHNRRAMADKKRRV